MMSFLLGAAFLAVFVTVKAYEPVSLVDNCKNLPDGEYYMKLIDDTDSDTQYPVIKAKCSNGYMIIDVNFDESMKEYFTSWAMWHSSIAGPTNADIVDWQSWFVKSREDPTDHKLLLSPDCSVCEEDHTRQHFDTKTTYWMSGNLFGCYWMILGKHNCDLDKDTYACYDCSSSSDPVANGDSVEITEDADPSAYYFTGQCATAVRAANSEVTASHDTCQIGLHYDFVTISGDDYETDYKTNVVTSEFADLADLSDYEGGAFVVDNFVTQVYKPSLGTDGRFCVCSQSSKDTNYIEVSKDELGETMKKFGDNMETFHQFSEKNMNSKINNIEEIVIENNEAVIDTEIESKEIKTSLNNNVELYQKDFISGTYRIKEAGTYVIMEDIEFDFNAGSIDDPQAAGAWKPTASQIEEYPGADTGRDEYFLGFFAGITVECDDVTLDLNGHEIKMSDLFYYQQRWFTVISLTSQFFLPGNGPGFFGFDPKSASNVVIKNGIIGLSSHFGIHGNYNKNVKIENVQVKGFEVHGMQFNGFEDLNLYNVEVGPSTKQAYFTGEYGHMRYVLDRLNNMIDDLEESNEIDGAYMNFYGRDATHVKELSEKCERMMNYAWDYVVKAKELTLKKDFDNDQIAYQEYLDAIDIFVNPSGIPYASVLHGIFLNTKEASVMTYNLYTTTYSYTAHLENVKIHDLEHSMDERVRMYNDIYMFFGPFLNCLNARQLVGDDAVDDALTDHSQWGGSSVDYKYQGSIVTDVYLALTKYSNNWDYLEKSLIGAHILVPWSEGERDLEAGTQIACNMDVMIHSGKGTTGLRLDGVQDITVKNLEIYNLHDSTPAGEMVCGSYSGFYPDSGGGHLAQQAPMQSGFSGNKVQAVTFNSAYDIEMENVHIYGMESDTGPVTGLAIWPANDITFKGELKFSDFQASTQLDTTDPDSYGMTAPNSDHYSCAVFLYESYYKENADATYTTALGLDFDNIDSCDVNADTWYKDCYKYVDSKGKMHLERLSDYHTFLKSANSDTELTCNTDDDSRQENKFLNGATSVFTESSPSLISMAVAGTILALVGLCALYFVLCRKGSDKSEKKSKIGSSSISSQVNYVPVGSNYGSI